MVNVQSFPLFQLPILAYENVIDFLHLKEKFDLSATSKKVTLIIKRYHQLKKHKLMIFPWCGGDSAQIFVYIIRGDKSHVKNSNSWDYDLGDDDNLIIDPTLAQITHIANVAPTASLRLKIDDEHPKVHTALIPLAKRLDLTLNSVEMCFDGYSPDDDDICRYVFENCKHAQTLIYYRETTPGFTIDPDSMGSYSFDFLDIPYLSWITPNHLKKCFNNCKHVELGRTQFSSQELNAFLTQWIQGSKIQELCLADNEPLFEIADVLVGITSVSHPYVHDKTFSCVATPGYVIKNSEGLEAVIYLTGDYFFLTTNFAIVDENYSLKVTSESAEIARVKTWMDYAKEYEADIRSLLPLVDDLQDSFNSRDKAILLKRSAFQLYLLRRVRALNHFGLLLSDGRVIKMIDLQLLYGVPLAEEMFQFAKRILQLGCTDEDIALFIPIVFYKPTKLEDLAQLELQNPENLSLAQQKFQKLFVKHAESRSLDPRIFHEMLLPELERLKVMHQEALAFLKPYRWAFPENSLFAEVYNLDSKIVTI